MTEKLALYNVDSLEYIKSLPDESVDLIVTDPPYRNEPSGQGGWGKKKYSMCDTKGYVFKNSPELEDYIDELYRVLKKESHTYIMCNNYILYNFLQTVHNSKFHYIKLLIWDKVIPLPAHKYMNRLEYIIMLSKGKERYVNNQKMHDILQVKRLRNKIHINEKPVELMEILVTQSTQEGDVVLDPFMGSGSTGIACMKNNRNFIGCEIDEKYYKIAKERIEEFNNKLSLF